MLHKSIKGKLVGPSQPLFNLHVVWSAGHLFTPTFIAILPAKDVYVNALKQAFQFIIKFRMAFASADSKYLWPVSTYDNCYQMSSIKLFSSHQLTWESI